MSALAAQFEARGVSRIKVRLQIAVAHFHNNGGTYDVALAVLNAAYGKGSGAGATLPQGQTPSASAPRTHDGVGLTGSADEAGKPLPAPSPKAAVGQEVPASAADQNVPAAAHKPGHSRRGLRSIASVQETISRSLFDTTKLPDGRRLREVRWSELPALASKYRTLSRVFMAIRNTAIPADPNVTVDQVVNEDRLSEIVQTVERMNDIA